MLKTFFAKKCQRRTRTTKDAQEDFAKKNKSKMPARRLAILFLFLLYLFLFLFQLYFCYFLFFVSFWSNLSGLGMATTSVSTYFWLFQRQRHAHSRRDRVRHVCPHSNHFSRLGFAAVLLPAFQVNNCWFFLSLFFFWEPQVLGCQRDSRVNYWQLTRN